ncbi:MAG: hypothetical protein ACK4NC_07305 [Candidatus Gracilibacteria bacterium]
MDKELDRYISRQLYPDITINTPPNYGDRVLSYSFDEKKRRTGVGRSKYHRKEIPPLCVIDYYKDLFDANIRDSRHSFEYSFPSYYYYEIDVLPRLVPSARVIVRNFQSKFIESSSYVYLYDLPFLPIPFYHLYYYYHSHLFFNLSNLVFFNLSNKELSLLGVHENVPRNNIAIVAFFRGWARRSRLYRWLHINPYFRFLTNKLFIAVLEEHAESSGSIVHPEVILNKPLHLIEYLVVFSWDKKLNYRQYGKYNKAYRLIHCSWKKHFLYNIGDFFLFRNYAERINTSAGFFYDYLIDSLEDGIEAGNEYSRFFDVTIDSQGYDHPYEPMHTACVNLAKDISKQIFEQLKKMPVRIPYPTLEPLKKLLLKYRVDPRYFNLSKSRIHTYPSADIRYENDQAPYSYKYTIQAPYSEGLIEELKEKHDVDVYPNTIPFFPGWFVWLFYDKILLLNLLL